MKTQPIAILLLTALTGLAGEVSAAAQTPAPAPPAETATAPVELDGVELFRLRGVSSLPAPERARRVRGQLIAVAADRAIPIESLRVEHGEIVSRIMAGDVAVLTIVDADADLEQVRRAELAGAHLDRVRRAIAEYREARTPAALRRSAIRALIATGLLMVVLAGLVRGWRWTDAFLTRTLRSRIHTVGIQSFEVMRAERIWNSLRGALLAVRAVALLSVALIYLGFVLAQFPATRWISGNMVALALVPLRVLGNGFVASIPNLVFLVVLAVIVRVGLRLMRIFFEAVGTGNVRLDQFDPEWAVPTYKLLRLAVVAFALVVAYPYIPGSGTAAFQGVSLFIGIVFSLGSTAAISNIIAGYMMTYRRALKVGDRVKIGDAIGDVIETRLQVTHLRSMKNEEIIIPNSQILAGDVLNYSSLAKTHGLILHTEVGIGYETPWRQVEAMLIEAADRTEGLAKDPRPFVLQKRLGDFAITYEINAYCRDVPSMNLLYTALHRNILDVFNEVGVQIMTPAYESDPPEPKIAPPGDWHARPAAPRPAAVGGRSGS